LFLNHNFNLEDRQLVKITGQRVKPGEVFTNPKRAEEPYEALRSLAVFELGYGGQLTSVDITDFQASIAVVTRVLNCVDTTIFSGTREDMTVLLEFAACYAAVVASRDLNKLSQQVLDTLGVNYNTLLLVKFSPIIIGSREVLSALAILAGARTEKDISLAMEVLSANSQSMNSGLLKFIEVIEYVRELECSFEDACQQIGGIRP